MDDHPEPPELLDDLPCGHVRTDGDGSILRVNRTFCSWSGYAREALVRAKRFQDLLTMGSRIFHQTHWQPLLQIQGSVAEVKLEIVHPDGHPIPMVINALQHVRDGAPVVEIAAYVTRDRDRYERELLASRRKLQIAVDEAETAQAQAKDRALLAEQMMGLVSHDLRNPLSTIGMGAELLLTLEPTPQQRAVLERVKRASDRSTHLVLDLLDFTQARLGARLKVVPSAFALHRVVHESVEDLAAGFRGRELRHRGEGGDGGDEVVADPHRVVQLVGNLVTNAITYGDPRRPIEVETRILADGFSVSVRNWGTPIDAALLPRIFEPLSRGDAKGDMRSLGLGLYIVDQIAKAHHGSVRVESDVDHGTLFEARFPLRPPE